MKCCFFLKKKGQAKRNNQTRHHTVQSSIIEQLSDEHISNLTAPQTFEEIFEKVKFLVVMFVHLISIITGAEVGIARLR